MIAKARNEFSRPLVDAMLLALWTGQRQGDLLTLTWSAIDGNFLRLKQSKGGRRVAVHIIKPLRQVLDAIPREADTILTNSRGEPWTGNGFRASWGKAAAKADIADLTFHDLRGSAVTRLAEAGCSEIEIASITGHSQSTVSAMLDRHYLKRTDAISESAGAKFEAAEEKRNDKLPDKPVFGVSDNSLKPEAEK